MQPEQKRILLVAIGNPLRGDDGIGHWVGQQVANWKVPGLQVRYMHQLHIDLLEELQRFDTVIVVDAALQNEPALLYEISVVDGTALSSHHADAATLKALHRQLYQQHITWMACAIKASDFEMGDPISAGTKQNGEAALQLLRQYLG